MREFFRALTASSGVCGGGDVPPRPPLRSGTEFPLYFQLSLSYHSSLRPLFCLFLSGGFTQILLYIKVQVGECYKLKVLAIKMMILITNVYRTLVKSV